MELNELRLEIMGIQRNSMVYSVITQNFVEFNGIQRNPKEYSGILKISMEFNKIQVEFKRIQWNSMEYREI